MHKRAEHTGEQREDRMAGGLTYLRSASIHSDQTRCTVRIAVESLNPEDRESATRARPQVPQQRETTVVTSLLPQGSCPGIGGTASHAVFTHVTPTRRIRPRGSKCRCQCVRSSQLWDTNRKAHSDRCCVCAKAVGVLKCVEARI